MVEIPVGKGEIAHYELFLLSVRNFQKTYCADMVKKGVCLEKG